MFFLALECNGNGFTKMMHLLVFHELSRMRVNQQPEIISISPEKTVLLAKNSRERPGRFDFLVREKEKTIGIEVLTRPSKGKMREKLAYANEVDEFIFALPENSLEFYRKKAQNGIRRVINKNFLPKEFSDQKLGVWLVDCRKGMVTEKGPFGKLFEVK